MDGNDNMVPLWFDGDCLQKLLIENDDVHDSDESDDDNKDDDIAMNELDYSDDMD